MPPVAGAAARKQIRKILDPADCSVRICDVDWRVLPVPGMSIALMIDRLA